MQKDGEKLAEFFVWVSAEKNKVLTENFTSPEAELKKFISYEDHQDLVDDFGEYYLEFLDERDAQKNSN